MSSFNKDRILEKVKKCFALSKSSNPNEAALALRQAHKLLKKHNLTVSEIELIDIVNGDVFIKKSSIKKYEINLSVVISKAFGCISVTSERIINNKKIKMLSFTGYSEDVKIANYSFEVLNRQLKAARKEYLKTLDSNLSSYKKQKLVDGFCLGWTISISEIVKDISPSNEEKINKINEKFNYKKARNRKNYLDRDLMKALSDGKIKGNDAKIWHATTDESEKIKYLE